ncbi:hypothetical protein BDQ17DRAFT_1429705 [Cyathus striatus]|nr:hypothetical protein BDQ17DRAFT_1429705 [Cyathus striatus]
MGIEELCDPITEQEHMSLETIDDDIFKAVMAMKNREQMWEMNGEDDGEEEAEYLADNAEPYARQLEHQLASFGREAHLEESQSMVPTTIMQYFLCS